MANIKSQKKRIRTNEIARVRNKAIRSGGLKTLVKHVHAAVEAGDKEAASAAATRVYRALDKAAAKGVIHKNQASNRKSGVQNLLTPSLNRYLDLPSIFTVKASFTGPFVVTIRYEAIETDSNRSYRASIRCASRNHPPALAFCRQRLPLSSWQPNCR